MDQQDQKDSQLLGNIILTAIMLGLMILSYTLWTNLKAQKMDHKQDMEEMVIKLELSSQKQVIYKQKLMLVANPTTKKILLAGTVNATNDYATVMYNPELNQILLDPTGMNEPPKEMSYQLWAKDKNEYHSLGVLDHDQDLMSISTDIPNIKSFLVTLQIEGGDNNPDLDYIMVEGTVRN